jgi:uncharacterized protein YoxC
MKNNVYWKQADGTSISVDDMDISHLRNAFKFLIKRNNQILQHANNIIQKYNDVVDDYNALVKKSKPVQETFALKGDMAQEFNNSFTDEEYDDMMTMFITVK